MSKAIIYFAIDDNDNAIYLASKQMCGDYFDSTFINEKFNLNTELVWEKEIPKDIGCYQAIIEFDFSDIEDFPFKVTSCTPLIYLK